MLIIVENFTICNMVLNYLAGKIVLELFLIAQPGVQCDQVVVNCLIFFVSFVNTVF